MRTLCSKSLFILALFFSILGFGQNNFEAFNETEFAINHGVSDTYKMNFALSSRDYLYTNDEFRFKVRQVQIGHFSTYKLDLKNSISAGLMYRNRGLFEDSSNEIRVTQQYVYKTLMSTLRTGHRLRSEQRFFDHSTTFRFRYRFTIDIPLQGLKLDTGESFFVLSNEALWSLNKTAQPSVDFRISPEIGWQISDDFILALGLTYRLENINTTLGHVLFFNTSAALKL